MMNSIVDRWFAFANLSIVAALLCACGGQTSGTGSADQIAPSIKRLPVPMVDANRISAGCNAVLALRTDGSVFFWGTNGTGMLGASRPIWADTPYLVPALNNIVSVKAGCGHGVALRNDGAVLTWGANNSGQLGNGTYAASLVPTVVPGITNVVAIAAGLRHTIAVTSDGRAWCWGNCNLGQFDADFTVPTLVPGIGNVVNAAASTDFTLLTKADGTLWTWGRYIYSGDGTTIARAYPVQVLSLTNVKAVGDGAESLHNLILQNDGTVWAWGSNLYYDLGIPSPSAVTEPFPLGGLASVKAVSSQYENSAAIRSDGSVYVWGNNSLGQLGNGSLAPTQTYVPVRFLDNGDAVAIAVGELYVLVLNRDGSVYGAGSNDTGQLGNNNFVDASVPKPVVGVGAVGILNLGVSTGP